MLLINLGTPVRPLVEFAVDKRIFRLYYASLTYKSILTATHDLVRICPDIKIWGHISKHLTFEGMHTKRPYPY